MAHFRLYGAVYVYLEKDGQVYLMRRANTGYRDGMWSLPAGHIEEGETLVQAVQRELLEETGLKVAADALVLKHVMYRRAGDRTYADYYFVCEAWHGEPKIIEADKCDGALWVDGLHMPDETVMEVKHAWACIRQGQHFSDINA